MRRNVRGSTRFARLRRHSFRIVQVVGTLVAVASAVVLVINACFTPASQVQERTTLVLPIERFQPANQKLTAHSIDVGQGDAILIEANGTVILVDGGKASANVEDYLQAQGIQDIDLMVATHPHEDHIGGLIDVLAIYDVHEIWTNGQTRDDKQFYRDFAAAVAAEGATEREVTQGYSTQMNGLEIDVLHPATPLSGDLNEDSVVLQVSCGEVAILLAGDATTDSEANMQAAGVLSDVEVLKVGHHGSNTSTSDAFLTAVTPEDAVISVGADNTHGHPRQETLDRLAGAGVTVYRTDEDGTVVLISDCATYSLEAAGS